MTTLGPRRLAARLALITACVVTSLAVPPAQADAATERLPDLRAARITDIRIVRSSDGRRLLRFTGTMWNSGAGPFETRSNRSKVGSPWRVDQIIYDSAGKTRRIRTTAKMQYAGDGHSHWHVQNVMTTHLWGANGTLAARKIGFCFFDTNLVRGSLPRSPSRRVYRGSSCGSRNSLSARNGISVGWADRYAWNLPHQWVDISGLPGGTYTIRAAVNLFREFTESSYTNNCAWARIRFNSTGTTVRVLSSGQSCRTDLFGHPYAADARWAMETGISPACIGDMFCPDNRIRRDQAAGIISRAIKAPGTDVDAYTDDESSTSEAHINRLAALGIALRCGEGLFCPTRWESRGNVARMLVAAYQVPPTDKDYFPDDAGLSSENAINRLAAIGAIQGCGKGLVCPKRAITKVTVAWMIHRLVEWQAAQPAPAASADRSGDT